MAKSRLDIYLTREGVASYSRGDYIIDMRGSVVESVYTSDLKSDAFMACGFESRRSYHLTTT